MKTRDPVQTTIDTYDQIAQKYSNAYFDYWKKEDKKYIDKFLSFPPPGAKILDVGCGPGNVAQYFYKKGFKVYGIDLSQEMIKIAKKNAPQVTFRVMDMRKLRFPQEFFDGLFAAYSLVYIPQKEVRKTLLGFKKVLKRKGILFLSLLEGQGERFLDEPLKPGRKLFLNFFTLNEVTKILQKLGFTILFQKAHTPKISEGSYEKTLFVIARKNDLQN